jgi:gamma-glutamyl hydrolase
MRLAGSRTIAIPYDISDEELESVLSQINGVLFTGGSLKLVDKKSGEPHPYYQTAKKIFDYSKTKFDRDNEEWPILGTCQGF